MKVRTIQYQKSGRPSLIAISKNHKKSSSPSGPGPGQRSNKSTPGPLMATETYDKYYEFQGFVNKMRFPHSLNINIQQRAYWLVSQPEHVFQWRNYVRDFLPKEFSSDLLAYGSILTPETEMISEVLHKTFLVGPPFPDLQTFRNVCLCNLPTVERENMTMNEVFRLYVAAYQHRNIWKEIWKQIKPILSTQIIKDVEQYVYKFPIDSNSVACVILFGTRIPPQYNNNNIHTDLQNKNQTSSAVNNTQPPPLVENPQQPAELTVDREYVFDDEETIMPSDSVSAVGNSYADTIPSPPLSQTTGTAVQSVVSTEGLK